MDMTKTQNNETLILALAGRLDTSTAPLLQEEMKDSLQGIQKLELDLEKLEYISSAGLRVILFLNKQCAKEGAALSVLNSNDVIKEVFQLTGFDGILDIQ